MTLLECLADPRVLSGEMWFRPVGDMYAYCVHSYGCDPQIMRVPGSRGGEPWLTNQVKALAGEWEIVSPDVVNDGLERLGRLPAVVRALPSSLPRLSGRYC